ncbi:pyridoxamine 5'-phosphate oxidase family protein [Candidatus Binatus sp.]|uniref:pyridoxamine 5'-phosphate oxidase family protein n=1 Tax=Candidatus Binatus sp. TaxID=2811406 RepID=UPI003BB19F76
MSKFFDHITPELTEFIRAQPVFFVATAAPEGRINLSPKGMDTFRVLDEKRVAYLDLTGSGNETAAHLLHDGRITIMFCSFDTNAEIARIYGRGFVIHPSDERWRELIANFPNLPGVRQVMEIRVESAMTSCGYAVPRMRETTARDTLEKYWTKKGEQEKEDYWQKHNLRSIDGLQTGMPETTPRPRR